MVRSEAGVVAGLSAICYAELASTVPVAGSAYTFSFATLGELVAFIIGAAAVFIVAVAWSPETRGRLDADANAGKRQKV